MTGDSRAESAGQGLCRRLRAEDTDRAELGMLRYSRIEGLVPMRIREEAEQISIQYIAEGLAPMPEVLTERNQEAVLYAVIRGLFQLSERLPPYFLSAEKLSLVPEEIFYDSGSGNMCFLYLPASKTNFQESLQRLMEFFLKHMNPQEEEKVLLLYGLYQKSRESTVQPETLFRYWESFRSSAPSLPFPGEPGVSSSRGDFPEDVSLNRGVFSENVSSPRDGFPEAKEPADRTVLLPTAPREYPPEGDADDNQVPDAFVYGARQEKLFAHAKDFFRKYRYEMLIAGIVIAGILLFIFI